MNIRKCECGWIDDVAEKKMHKCYGCGTMVQVADMHPVPSNIKNKNRVELNSIIVEVCYELFDDVSNGRIRLSTE